jgi:hypothetical protein
MWKDIIFSTEIFFNLLLSRLYVVIFSVKQKGARLFVFTLPRDIQQSGALIKVDGHMCENGERCPRVAHGGLHRLRLVTRTHKTNQGKIEEIDKLRNGKK